MNGIYIHIPFCLQKCKYCDFVSFAKCGFSREAYFRALFAEMERYRGMEADTVFIGGGTPTVCRAEELEELMKKLSRCFCLAPNAEITMEANPKTLDSDKLIAMKRGGVNRLSLGVQSFSDRELQALGRIHTAEEAEETIRLIQKIGGFSLNLDLMTAIPYQTANSLSETLARAVSYAPEHISCYSLILEAGTPLATEYERGHFRLLEEEEERALYWQCTATLHNAGYHRYEISNFAREERECRHNLKYWQCRDYIGLGMAAHSCYRGKRFSNPTEWKEYAEGKQILEEVLTEKEEIEEFMIMGLRLSEGVSEKEFQRRFSRSLTELYSAQLEKFQRGGFLECRDGYWRLTDRGISVSNAVLCEFLLDDMKKSN